MKSSKTKEEKNREAKTDELWYFIHI